ncbi:recombinase RecT (plasmid) [Arsenophonus nasoniae]|uniref:RecT family protein n=2 Tax=Arsenophonus nasoniae TaxID=638 RepID=A0A4P7L068_9GAMM|nr:recombinase RecT [Arsenophonus nasoniae]QBY45975.1 RecT family protein [Arsenophonus nasoniae]QBY46069.1 RecT family protein [Arsenophonus nasoniae]WGM08986.1 recombinase RecT [Arsenophonus nasoniae]WGM13656.1 recombinase RecT [Arsenophonus nasoniae]WGM18266.1 recombinase RecT [Arsenophonus nasoniae]
MNTELETMTNVYTNLQSVIMQQGIAALLPAQVTPEQFTRTAATALIENTELQNADKQSLVLALTRCAKDGLMPDGREAALIVRKQKAVYMPMVDGVIKRARQSGQVANIIAKVVYAQDEFEYVIDENGEHLTHRPSFVDGDEIVKVYAFAKLNSGELVVEVMSRADVEKIRNTVKSAKDLSSPWVKWFDRMALKTVIHRLARRLPCASELFSMFEVYEDANSTEKPLRMAPASFKRLSLRDVIRERNEKLRQKAEAVIDVPTEAQRVTHPKLEAALIALDDATAEKNLAEIVEHCTLLSAELSEDEKIQLREKIKASKKRLIPAKKDSDVWMARLANGTGDAWRFPDGEIVHGFFEAEKKAKETGEVLEERKKYRFSPSH